jgi:hypothetical protein
VWILWGLVVHHFSIDERTFESQSRCLVLISIVALIGQASDIAPSDLTSIKKRTY